MSSKLNDEDGRAVDLLLDGSDDGNANGEPSFAAPASAAFHQRVRGAEKLLELISEMPAMDPPADLVAKTMQRIEERNLRDSQMNPSLGAPADEGTSSIADI